MNSTGTALHVFLACAGLVAVAWSLFALVRIARRGGRRMRSFGAAMMLFGWGHMRDPRNDTVAEANEGRVRRGTDSGDGRDRR